MQPSSLIFLVLIGVWAVYLVQYWIKRHDHVMTARAADRFSDAMRVLERRRPEIDADSATRTRPAGLSRVDVIRARPVVDGGPAARVDGDDAVAAASPAAAPTVEPTPPSPRRSRVTARVSSRLSRAPRAPRSRKRVRATLGLLLLAALVAVPVLTVTSALGVTPWWSVPLALVAAAAAVVVLARTARAARTAARRATGVGPGARAGRPTSARTAARRTEPYDAHAAECGEPTPDASRATGIPEGAHEADEPGRWTPRPVPPPTYALKDPAFPPAPRRATRDEAAEAPAADAAVGAERRQAGVG